MTDLDSFERSFVAVSYLLGRRAALTDGLEAPGAAATELAAALAKPSREARAKALAGALRGVAADFDARRCE
jgi:hypothetical protein